MEEFGSSFDVIPLCTFEEKALPPPPVNIGEVEHFLLQNGSIEAGKGFSAMFKRDAKAQGEHETIYFLPLAEVHSLIVEAAISIGSPNLSPTLEYVPCGNRKPESDRKSTTKPDGYQIINDNHPLHSAGIWNTDQAVTKDNWLDVIRCDEYKKKNSEADRLDNIEKVCWNSHHVMRNDARRRFTFGLTIEETDTRMWFFNRQAVRVSQSFNYMTEPKHLIHYILSLSFATLAELGFDMSMTLYKDPSKKSFDYEIRLREKTYRTVKVLSDFRADALRGRATRVFEAKEIEGGEVVSGPSVVIKDSWMDADRDTEGDIQRAVLHDLPKELHQYFREIVADNYVLAGDEVDHTSLVHLRGLEITDASKYRLPIVKDDSHVEPQQSLGLEIDPDLHESATEGFIYYPKVHYRIIFKDVCQPLEEVRSWPTIYKALGDVVEVVTAMYAHGKWVHRDLSTGNILVDQSGNVQLSDLEFANKTESEGLAHHAMRTGTIHFMACEVQVLKYLFAPRSSGLKPSLALSLESNFDEEKDGDSDTFEFPFVHHTLHDLESIWWIFMRFLWRYIPDRSGYSKMSLKNQEVLSKELFPGVLSDVYRRDRFSTTDLGKYKKSLADQYCQGVFAKIASAFQRELIDAYTKAEKDIRSGGKISYDGFPEAFKEIQSIFSYELPEAEKVPTLIHIHDALTRVEKAEIRSSADKRPAPNERAVETEDDRRAEPKRLRRK
ncbi:hypothetical protein CPB84DRAFT_1765365 [Gymnopilus junonius]|uniref:Protein kinase domain-containing protein n=1 Tax=Gymnopilus junonius TaxID=109634 RepID=A0A9P5NV65_GYMJU|nr:hypothetical protein CPB84DRAFT_1765365 [Gymnopilus junonius]